MKRMIRIDIDSKIDEIKKNHKNDFMDAKTGEYTSIKDALNNLKKYGNFYNFFCVNNKLSDNKIEKLLTISSKSRMIKYIKEIDDAIQEDTMKNNNKDKILKDIENEFVNLFKNFSNRNWAVDFLKLINVRVCPYCNRAYTFTVYEKTMGRKSKAELDHYFPKNLYPYMAISIFNIVPSCSLCNKGKSNNYVTIDAQNILYLYEEGFDNKINFTLSSKNFNYIFDLSREFSIKLKSSSNKYSSIIKSYNDAFKIDHLYSMHSDYVQEIIQKAIVYNDIMIKEIYTQYPNLFESEEEVKQMILGNYTKMENLGRRPLAKLTKDIWSELREDKEL